MQRVGSWTELLRVFDGELNPIYCHSRLVCHFEFDRCRPRFCLRLNRSENLMHNLRSHRFNTPSRRSFALPAKPTTRFAHASEPLFAFGPEAASGFNGRSGMGSSFSRARTWSADGHFRLVCSCC